jgi:predicted PhzF superfamily epimerase YddE/YHI9
MYQVDAFTERPFAGNPAAVFVLPGPRDDRWLQDVAREMNLSETAFLVEAADGYDLRWFTPCTEVELCGHATLASAHVLWETGRLRRDEQARFHTRSGLLTVVYTDGGWIEMPRMPRRTACCTWQRRGRGTCWWLSTYEEKPEISPWSPFEAHLPDVPVINIMKKFVLPL